MKLAGMIFVSFLCFSSLSFADLIYVRKSIAGTGAEQVQADTAQGVLKEMSTEKGHKVVPRPAEAKTSFRATVSKSGDVYNVKVEKIRGGKNIGSGQGSGPDVAQATRQAAEGLIEISTGNDVVVENYPMAAGESRQINASGEETTVIPVDTKHPNYVKNWYVGLGPVVTNSLLGTNGTKFSVSVAYNQGLAEHWDLLYFYDGDFNTASLGSTAVTEIGAALNFFPKDRGSEGSPFLRADLGFGGGNKTNDATGIVGGGVGYQFFRKHDFTFEVMVRIFALLQNGSAFNALPNDTDVCLGIYF
jgi:hypothetical protein